MRKALDALYAATAALAALSLVSIAVIIVAQVAARSLGTQVRGADEFAGYALVATCFLAFAPTYRAGEHIRVGIAIERFAGGPRRALEILVLAVCGVAVAWATWWIGRFVWDSYRFHELSQGLVPIPLWIPQSAMFVGLAVLLVALAEDLVAALRGRTPSYLAAKPAGDGPAFER